jgi:hypothetical protein
MKIILPHVVGVSAKYGATQSQLKVVELHTYGRVHEHVPELQSKLGIVIQSAVAEHE